jgi:outer membrane protein OmpA-like peptidoglycan-associated protein
MQFLEEFKKVEGVVIAIDYNSTYAVKKLVDVNPQDGPEITLGVYPNAINPARGRGVILEFSVIETAGPIKEWTFQLMLSDKKGKLEVIESIKGNNAAFHQIYWNGRRNFTGSFYPRGKYICMLSAVDISGGTTKINKYFTVVMSGNVNKYLSKPVKSGKVYKRAAGSSEYVIKFASESINIEEDQIEVIEKIAGILDKDKKRQVSITSFGYSKETDYADYAMRRASVVKRILVDEYGISAERVQVNTAVSDDKPRVLVKTG